MITESEQILFQILDEVRKNPDWTKETLVSYMQQLLDSLGDSNT